MLRVLSRFIGVWLVAAALVVAVVDGAKSIASSNIALTSTAETWATISAYLPAGASSEAGPLPWPGEAILAWLMSVPSVAVLAVLGFLLVAAGRRRRRPAADGAFAI